jgi:hypothetical protein
MEWPDGAAALAVSPPSVPRTTEWPPATEDDPAPAVSRPCMVCVAAGAVQPDPAAQVVLQLFVVTPQVSVALQTGTHPATGGGTELGSMVSEQPVRPSSSEATSARRRI